MNAVSYAANRGPEFDRPRQNRGSVTMAPTTAMKMDPREAELQRQIAIAKNVLRSEAKVLEALSKK